MSVELWIYFTAIADSFNPEDREKCILLERETDSMEEMLSSIPIELLTASHVFCRGFPNRVELEIHV